MYIIAIFNIDLQIIWFIFDKCDCILNNDNKLFAVMHHQIIQLKNNASKMIWNVNLKKMQLFGMSIPKNAYYFQCQFQNLHCQIILIQNDKKIRKTNTHTWNGIIYHILLLNCRLYISKNFINIYFFIL